MVILSTIALSFVNSTDPSEMKVLPNHLFAFTHHPVLNGDETFAIMFIIYLKRPKLMNHFKRLFMNRLYKK